MIVPVGWAVALALLGGAAARADAAPSRTKRERPVAVVSNPDEPLPEIHVAADSPTVLLFPADIQTTTLTVDESRIRVVDTGRRSIIVQVAPDYRADERHELAVLFADGQAPARAAFVLVIDPTEVDTWINVQRPEPPTAACPADVQHRPMPEDFVLLGYVNERGVQTAAVPDVTDSEQGLSSTSGISYRGNGWMVVDVTIRNLPDRSPWTPRDVVLKVQEGASSRARLVKNAKGAVAPGERVRVLAVLDTTAPNVGVVVALEVLGDDGRSLVIPLVTPPSPEIEGEQ